MFDFVKEYNAIPKAVVLYDERIKGFIEFAKRQLHIAGIVYDETDVLQREYIATYTRLRLQSEPSRVFLESEEARLGSLIELMTYGGDI